MRILFFMQCLGVGGVERQFFLLADHLVRRGHHISIAALHILDHNWVSLWDPDGFYVHIFFAKTPGDALSAASQLIKGTLKLRNLIKEENIQLVYSTQWAISNFIAWLATRGRPDPVLVWGVRGTGRDLNLRRIGWKMALLSQLCKWISPSVSLSISNSKSGQVGRQARGYRCQKDVVIFNGIEVIRFEPNPEARIRVRTEWTIPDNIKLIGLVGRLHPMKDHVTFIKAAALLVREHEDVRFVCIGDGPKRYRNQLQRLSEELGLSEFIIWAGVRDDMPAAYNALDILCSSSSYGEGFPNVIGEAMACGVPCVVTDVGDSAKIVANTGIVVGPDDPQMLAGGLSRLLERLHEVEPYLLRERILKHFSVERMVDATEEILIEVSNGVKKK